MFIKRFLLVALFDWLTSDSNFAHIDQLPMLVAARSKAWVCGRSLTGTAGSNPTGDMDVCLL